MIIRPHFNGLDIYTSNILPLGLMIIKNSISITVRPMEFNSTIIPNQVTVNQKNKHGTIKTYWTVQYFKVFIITHTSSQDHMRLPSRLECRMIMTKLNLCLQRSLSFIRPPLRDYQDLSLMTLIWIHVLCSDCS